MIVLHKFILKLAFLGLGWAQVYRSQLGLMMGFMMKSFMRGSLGEEENKYEGRTQMRKCKSGQYKSAKNNTRFGFGNRLLTIT